MRERPRYISSTLIGLLSGQVCIEFLGGLKGGAAYLAGSLVSYIILERPFG